MPNRATRRAMARRQPLTDAEADAAKEKVLGAKREGGLSSLFSGKPPTHMPILKALGNLGIEVRIKTVMIGEQPTDCVVIPTQELLVKEYALLSGVDPNILLDGAN